MPGTAIASNKTIGNDRILIVNRSENWLLAYESLNPLNMGSSPKESNTVGNTDLDLIDGPLFTKKRKVKGVSFLNHRQLIVVNRNATELFFNGSRYLDRFNILNNSDRRLT